MFASSLRVVTITVTGIMAPPSTPWSTRRTPAGAATARPRARPHGGADRRDEACSRRRAVGCPMVRALAGSRELLVDGHHLLRPAVPRELPGHPPLTSPPHRAPRHVPHAHDGP